MYPYMNMNSERKRERERACFLIARDFRGDTNLLPCALNCRAYLLWGHFFAAVE
jgi:hypothetical protein